MIKNEQLVLLLLLLLYHTCPRSWCFCAVVASIVADAAAAADAGERDTLASGDEPS